MMRSTLRTFVRAVAVVIVDACCAAAARADAATRYVAVSASLQYGPWGPDGLFRPLDGSRPVATTDDGTIAVYRNPTAVRLMSDVP